MKNIILLVAALIAVCTASCTPKISTTQRAGTWQSGGGTAAIYDIVISNAGTCPITAISINIALPTGATLGESWNLIARTGYYDVTSFEPQLPVGATVNAGVVVTFPTTSGANLPGITVTLRASSCPSSCAPTTAPTNPPTNPPTSKPTNPPTNPPTSKPTNPPTNTPTNPPTSKPTNPPTSKPTNPPTGSPCNVDYSLRTGSTWVTDGVPYGTYYIFLTNNGPCNLVNFVAGIVTNSGANIYQTWNLSPVGNSYTVGGYGGVLNVGDSYGGSGFNIRNVTSISLQNRGSTCRC